METQRKKKTQTNHRPEPAAEHVAMAKKTHTINVQFLQTSEQQAPPVVPVVDEITRELGGGEAADG